MTFKQNYKAKKLSIILVVLREHRNTVRIAARKTVQGTKRNEEYGLWKAEAGVGREHKMCRG